MYRESDGYVYLRNSNTQGIADIRSFFGNPGDIPIVGDFDADGCDTSIYRHLQALGGQGLHHQRARRQRGRPRRRRFRLLLRQPAIERCC